MQLETSYVLMVIILSGVVTWLPRVLPFFITKHINFSKNTKEFLSYLPMCILLALLLQSLFSADSPGWTVFDVPKTIVAIPTITVAVLTKSLLWTVLIGVLTMAFYRYFI